MANKKVSETGCKLIVKELEVSAKFSETYERIKAAISKIVKAIADFKMGILDISGGLLGSLAGAIAGAASAAASAIAGAAAAAAAAALEAILAPLLTILMSAPEAIFSIIAIPIEQARDAVDKEREKINDVKHSLNMIVTIIDSWKLGVPNGDVYYRQMKAAMNAITNSLASLDVILEKLGDDENSEFDNSEFDKLKSNLNAAIEATIPQSNMTVIDALSKKIELKKSNIIKKGTIEIDKKVAIKRKDKLRLRNLDIAKVQSWGANDDDVILNPEAAAKISIIDAKYNTSLSGIDVWKKSEMTKLAYDAEIKARENYKNNISDTINDMQAKYNIDIVVMKKESANIYESMRDAYLAQKASKTLTYNIYKSRSIINTILAWLISVLRDVGNGAGKAAMYPLGASKKTVTAVKEMYEESIANYEDKPGGAATLDTALKLPAGHMMLLSAEAVMAATITDSLIKLINSDDVLQADADNFDKFLVEIEGIYDFGSDSAADGKNTWGTKVGGGGLTPYTQLIIDVKTISLKAPMAVVGGESSRNSFKKSIADVSTTIDSLLEHNAVVSTVLHSYTPYQSPYAKDLKDALDMLGLLSSFALTMSMVALVEDIIGNENRFSAETPSYDTCVRDYPEMFADPKLAASLNAAIKRKENNRADMSESDSSSLAAEENEKSIQESIAAVESYRFIGDNEDDTYDQPMLIKNSASISPDGEYSKIINKSINDYNSVSNIGQY